MPARTVVIESLMKFTGEKHEIMTPGQYTQLSGRAGRRGIDEVGHCVVLLQKFVPFDGITRLASTRTYPLQSSFRPSYNMAVNLIRNYDRDEAERLVNSSFAQFQADRDVVRLERSRERSEGYLASYRERVQCDLGDIDAYLDLREKLRSLEDAVGHKAMDRRIEDAIHALRPGDVFDIEVGKRRGRYAVLEVSQRRSERRPRVLALSPDRSMVRFGPVDFTRPPRPIARVDMPRNFRANEAADRREITKQLKSLKVEARPRERAIDLEPSGSDEERELIEAIEAHPCHHCPDIKRHIHYAERAQRLEKEVRNIDRRVGKRTGTLARMFEKVLEVLESLDYVKGWNLTSKGERLARVYNESDLLVVEALDEGLAQELSTPELSALLSTLVYETRGPEAPEIAEMPTKDTSDAWTHLMQLWRKIRKEEDRRRLDLTREPDPGFALRAHMWTSGAPLEDVLSEGDAPGDFVRSMKQLIDLLRQIEEIAPTETMADRVHEALIAVQRGVVAYSSIDT
jgi:ATP-dependent RNA helicase HelY